MRKTILLVSLLLLFATGCAAKKKQQPQINLFLTPPPQVPFVDLHNPFTLNSI
jgi:hypothetical protein